MMEGSMVGHSRKFVFRVKAESEGTKITRYVIDFGDGTSRTLNVVANTTEVSAEHVFGGTDESFTVRATVIGANGERASSDLCIFNAQPEAPTTAVQEECKPGVPADSEDCNVEEQQPVVLGASATTPTPPAPTEEATILPSTGAAAGFTLFGATTVAGAMLHRLVMRRRHSD
jgi:hypothetical protein